MDIAHLTCLWVGDIWAGAGWISGTCYCEYLCRCVHMLWFLLAVSLGGELLGHMLLTLLRNCQPVFQSGCCIFCIFYSVSRAGRRDLVFCILVCFWLLPFYFVRWGVLSLGIGFALLTRSRWWTLVMSLVSGSSYLFINAALLQLCTPSYQEGLLFYSCKKLACCT